MLRAQARPSASTHKEKCVLFSVESEITEAAQQTNSCAHKPRAQWPAKIGFCPPKRSHALYKLLCAPLLPFIQIHIYRNQAFRARIRIKSAQNHFASALVVYIFELPRIGSIWSRVAGKSDKRTRLETVERIYEALKAGDAGALHGLMVKHIEWWFHGPPQCQHLMSILTGKCRPDCYNFKPHLMVNLLGEQQQQNEKNQHHHHQHNHDHDHEEENGPQQKPEKKQEEEVRVLVEGCSGCSSYWVHVWTVCIRHSHSHSHCSTGRVTQLREYFNTSIVVRNFSPPTGSGSDSDSDSGCSCSALPLAVWESSILQRFPYPMPSLILAI